MDEDTDHNDLLAQIFDFISSENNLKVRPLIRPSVPPTTLHGQYDTPFSSMTLVTSHPPQVEVDDFLKAAKAQWCRGLSRQSALRNMVQLLTTDPLNIGLDQMVQSFGRTLKDGYR